MVLVKQKYLILLSLAGFIICLDQLTKLWVKANVTEGNVRPLLSWLWATHYRNKSFAVNLMERLPTTLQNLFFIAVPVFALFLIVLIFIKLQDNQMPTSVALTSILGGAIGNMIDRIQTGPVLDILQIRLGNWSSAPFNLADLAISLGVIIVFIYTSLSYRTERQANGGA